MKTPSIAMYHGVEAASTSEHCPLWTSGSFQLLRSAIKSSLSFSHTVKALSQPHSPGDRNVNRGEPSTLVTRQ